VIPNFMIQGGGFTRIPAKPTAPVPIESEMSYKAGLRNEPGTVAMARTGDRIRRRRDSSSMSKITRI
jgi:peptidyl-prolyl cis-trans isomerase A (cyclophilin A)